MSRLYVDIHPHIISTDDETYPKNPLGGKRSVWSLERPATWEQYSEQMELAGVQKAAIVQSSTTYGHDNSYLADTVDANPGRITGVCSVGLMDDDALWQIRHWILQRGMSGVRLFTAGSTIKQGTWLTDEKAQPGWEMLAEHRVPVCVNMDRDALPMLRTVIERNPDLVVIIDHLARTNFDDGPPYSIANPVYEMAEFPNVHVKISTRTLKTGKESAGGSTGALKEIISHFGSNRMAWGSNYPASEGTLADLKQLLLDAVAGLDDDDAENICGRTALKLYPKLAVETAAAAA